MELRDKLARLTLPGPRGRYAETRAWQRSAVDGPAPSSLGAPHRDAADGAGQEHEEDAERAVRIARLRALIGDVMRRGDAFRASSREAATAPPPAGTAAERHRSQQLRAHILGQTRLELPVVEDREPASRAGGRPSRVRAPLPWPTQDTPHGPVHVVERWLEPDHRHGKVAVRSAIERLPETFAALALDPALRGLDLSRMLFLDTETTGLAGGTGSVAFLVGLAQFDEGVLKITQLLVVNLGGEAPMLSVLAKRLAAASCILTYNGKSFDWPLLRTRFVLNRMRVPELPPHVDLLHATRRVWKPRLGSLKLTDIERQILRFSREDDLEGSEIPSRYFSFLHDGGSEWLVPVLEHNQNDLIALPAMLGTLGERFERMECGEQVLDALAFGRLALRWDDAARAQAFARAAIAASDGSSLAPRAWTFSGEVERRAGDAAAAAAHYERALALCSEPAERAALHAVLARLYEHALRDLASAYRHARCTEAVEGPERSGRRLGRVLRKLLRGQQPRGSRARRRRP